MKSLQIAVGISLAGVVFGSVAQDRDGMIRDALQRGAHVVSCSQNVCIDQQTMKVAEHDGVAPDGMFLVYPDTPDQSAAISRTQSEAKALGY